MPSDLREVIEAAWGRVVGDCGCSDMYYCPAAGDVECPQHSGFDVCCDRPDEHVALPVDLRAARPRPTVGPERVIDPRDGRTGG